MDERRIAEKITRWRVAGLVEPPPRMVDDIFRWAKAKMAAHTAWHTEKDIVETRQYLQKALEQAAVARELGDIERAEEREERAQYFKEGIEKEEIRLVGLKQEAKSFPRVKPGKWNRVGRNFKVDMRGWKYLLLVQKADPKRVAYANDLFGVIKVELVRGNINSKGGAYWKPSTSTFKVQIGTDLKSAIRHELVHWAQSYLDIALWIKDFGRPSKSIRTPDIDQHAAGKLKKQLMQRGVKPDEFHNLDDIEFYTDLRDAIDSFERFADTWGDRDGHFTSKMDILKVFVGLSKPPAGLGWRGDKMVNHFFSALKRNAQGKWKKAVKELMKAAL